MTLRGKLIVAQAPLALALVFVGAVSAVVTARLGGNARSILANNYRSVLAAGRMKEALERIDSCVLLILAGHADGATAGMAQNRTVFDRELAVQETNITEALEADLTLKLRSAWQQYERAIDVYQSAGSHAARDLAYVSTLEPSFRLVNQLADEILGINQDAMVQKAMRAEHRARRFERVVVVAVLSALLLGVLASTWLTTRVLRPLRIVSAAVRRFGDDDRRARAEVQGDDEIAALAQEFNRMADRLERYRASSLGELLQAQQAAQAAIDGLPDPVLLLNGTGDLQGANAAAATLLGVSVDETATDLRAGVDPAVRVAVDRLRAHVLGGRGSYVSQGFDHAIRVTATPEGERIFLPRAMPILGERGLVVGAAIAFQDATLMFRFDELKNNLVATVAHEFRTPLTSLRMALHLCTEQVVGPLTPKQADLLFAAKEDCERLQLIVDDLLDLSRIEAGRVDLRLHRVEPGTLIAPAIDAHEAAARQARVGVRVDVLPGLPEVLADPDRLRLVFMNLLGNAIRNSPAGGEVIVRAAAVGPTQVRFEVSDQGPGIAVAHQAGLFEKFFRVPGSAGGGSGLGLFIAKELVQAHGGAIGVDSDAGRGATFWFTIPTAPAASGATPSG